MKFILLTSDYSGFQLDYEPFNQPTPSKLTLEWYGPVDFTGIEYIGLSNIHIFPLRFKKNSHSAIISANFIQPTLYNPLKVLSTIRIDAHSGHTPICNFKGNLLIMSHSL